MPVTINGNGHISGLVVGGLPDGSVDADTLATHAVTTNKIANSAVTSAQTSGLGGLAMVDIWDLNHVATRASGSIIYLGNTSTYSSGPAVWTRATWNGTVGSAMTVSNEVFTFPSTGIYEIQYTLSTWNQSNTQNAYIYARIYATTNNGSNWYNRSADGNNAIARSGTVYTHCKASYIFDVTDISNDKVKFGAQAENGATVNGDASSDNNLYTYVIFKKLGDT